MLASALDSRNDRAYGHSSKRKLLSDRLRMTDACVYQERLGVELTTLIEDPSGATAAVLAAEAHAKMAAGNAGRQMQPAAMQSTWISACPVTVKMRLFCLPYAGGVSENVFGRCCPML